MGSRSPYMHEQIMYLFNNICIILQNSIQIYMVFADKRVSAGMGHDAPMLGTSIGVEAYETHCSVIVPRAARLPFYYFCCICSAAVTAVQQPQKKKTLIQSSVLALIASFCFFFELKRTQNDTASDTLRRHSARGSRKTAAQRK